MRKIKMMSVVVGSAMVLASCGGGSGKTTIDFKSDGEFLKGFEHKSTSAFKGGMQWNGTRNQQTIEIAVSNSENIVPGPYGGFVFSDESKENDNSAIIQFKLSGKQYDKDATPIYIKEGDEFKSGDSDYGLDVTVLFTKYKIVPFNGRTSSSVTEFEGTAKITKLTDSHVEGTIDFKRTDGTSSIKVNFSEKYKDTWKEKGFE